MKILIDSNDAKVSSLGGFYTHPEIDSTGIWLAIHVEMQLKARWCWAAIARAVGIFYETCNITQVDLVKNLLTDIHYNGDNYSKIERQEYNLNFKLDIALKYVDSFSHWTPGKPIFERIQFEINQGRPFGARLEWFKGGAHYVLVRGYNAEQRTLFIEDSLHGSSIEPYDRFPDEYNESGAVWTETFWTNKLITK